MTPTPINHQFGCVEYARIFFANRGIDINVLTEPPATPSPYSDRSLTCPHDVTFWFEPTADQVAQWARDGVR